MPLRSLKTAALLLLAALLTEVTLCQSSFWGTLTARGIEITEQAEIIYDQVPMEEMETRPAADNPAADTDAQGYVHIPEGAALVRLSGLEREVSRLFLKMSIPDGSQVKATLFAQDEGNAYVYQLGEGRILLPEVPENAWMKLYPYGKVKNLYLRLETADRMGQAAAGAMGELVCRIEGAELNGRMPFVFRPVRLFLLFAFLGICYVLRAKSRIHTVAFTAAEGHAAGRRNRQIAMVTFTVALLLLTALFVQINQACQQNLAPHHAQYQELAETLTRGSVCVGEADPALLEVENPYDTINLQAKQIPYRADYAYREGRYYVYFGIVPELLLYLPFYCLTGRALPNYFAVFVFYAGFVVASAGLVCEMMKRWFRSVPFYLWGIGTGMLTAGSAGFYLLIRPDLYHVPIAASFFFTALGLWCYLAGLNREKKRTFFYLAGSLCLALNAGCRPQFLLFAFLAVPLFWQEIFQKRTLFSKKGLADTAALALPYAVVAAGIMYYNAVRFGSPFDFGATYSMTSNDMTHRGFNVERILYGFWYFLFQPPHLEAEFPFLQSAAIETEYLGKLTTESCFGGIFACSMLTWPAFALLRLWKHTTQRQALCFAGGAALAALIICAADATGAGILQRYSADFSFGIFLAAFVALLALAAQAGKKAVYPVFVAWLRAALLLHGAFLFLILVNTDSSVNLLTGNPVLYYTIRAALRW